MNLLRQTLGAVLATAALFGLFLFVPAWTLHWQRAWILLAVVVIATIATMVVAFRNNEGLLRERKKSLFQRDQPLSDKLVLVPFIVSFYGQIVFIPLDVFRWHLLPPPNFTVASVGLVLFVVGWWLMTEVFRVNAFAAPVVKYQKDRDHRVIDTGVYARVRHPMYSGVMLLLPGMALWLGSTAGALFAVVPVGLLAVRILVEEDFLRRELPGYPQYVQRVRWRLVPGIW